MHDRRLIAAFLVMGALAACSAPANRSAQSASSSGSAQSASAPGPAGYARSDLVGSWKCNWTNGRYSVVETSTIRADGTSVGNGSAYGHTTPTYETSWSYTPSGPSSGTMNSNNTAFAPPHYSATASVTWMNHNHFAMVTLTDHPNVSSVGSRMDCTRTS